MTIDKTILIFRSIAGLFFTLTIFSLLVLSEEGLLIQIYRIISVLLFGVATFTTASKYHDKVRYFYASLYFVGIIMAIPLIVHAYNREVLGPDYAAIVFRLLQIEIFIIFMVVSLNKATENVKSDANFLD